MSMETIDAAGIDAMAQRFRANFINSLSGYKSANLVGTCNEQQQTNLATETEECKITKPSKLLTESTA